MGRTGEAWDSYPAGFRGTYALIDPKEELILLLFAQSRVGGTPGQQFIDSVYAAIVE